MISFIFLFFQTTSYSQTLVHIDSCDLEQSSVFGKNTYENLFAFSNSAPHGVSSVCKSMKIPPEKVVNLGSSTILNRANDFYDLPACGHFGSGDQGCRKYAKLMYQELYSLYEKRESLISKYQSQGMNQNQAKNKANQVVRFFADDPGGMKKVCPNFHTFSDQKRLEFWIILMGAMTKGESTCLQDSRAMNGVRGVNDTAVGAFQFEKSVSRRRSRDKVMNNDNPELTHNCSAINFSQRSDSAIQAQFQCALRMMNAQLRGVYSRDGEIFDQGSYWAVLRPNGWNSNGSPKNSIALKTWAPVQSFPGCR